MILFYHPETKRIVGVFHGRLHSEEEHNAHVGHPGEFQKFVIPMTKFDDMREDGLHSEYLPDEPFRGIVLKFESGEEDPVKYRVIEENGTVKQLQKVIG